MRWDIEIDPTKGFTAYTARVVAFRSRHGALCDVRHEVTCLVSYLDVDAYAKAHWRLRLWTAWQLVAFGLRAAWSTLRPGKRIS